MRYLIAANWKMNASRETARMLAMAARQMAHERVEIVLCPPAVWLTDVADALEGSDIALGAQDCHAQAHGAFTGDIAAPMLDEAGCGYVILGHSERRAFYHETSEQVREKAVAARAAGLQPIICVGEPWEIREHGQAEAFVGAQARASVPDSWEKSHFVLAYEPVWAIGTGRVPQASDIQAMHAHLAGLFPKAQVLYGGSVNAANALEILGLPGIGGALVGGASLKPAEFGAIVSAARVKERV